MVTTAYDRRKGRVFGAIALVAGVCGLIGYLMAEPEARDDLRYLRNSSGAVLFDHAGHQGTAGACADCHHELVRGVASCADCHDGDYTPELAEHEELAAIEGHECEGCHELAGDDEARGCRACHPVAAAEGAAFVGCAGCHDDDTPDLADHAELTAIDGHECEGCHTPRAVAEVYHAQCNGCHLATDPGRFADAQGAAACGACHLK